MSVIPAQPYIATNRRPYDPGARFWLLNALLLLWLAASVTVWGVIIVGGVSGYELEEYISLAGFFGAASAFFVVSRVSGDFQGLFDMPVFMTIIGFVMFGVVPLVNFIDPSTLPSKFHGDTSLFHVALEIVVAGMFAFWLGAGIARSKEKAPAALDRGSLPGSAPRYLTLVFGACLYIAGFVAKVYMLRAGLFSYLASQSIYQSRLAEAQVWLVMERFGFYALILFIVEAHSHPGDKVRAALFWAVLGSECFWGLISGMKRSLLENFLAVALLFSMTGRKLRIRWFAVAILGLIVVYPLINQYRSIVRKRDTTSVTDVDSATEAMRGAAGGAANQVGGTAGGWLASGWTSSVNRVNMLQDMALMLVYESRSYLLEGKERAWMIPFYPLVPRLVWPGKPIDDKGLRMARLLGVRTTTYAAITVPGDLYVFYYGIPGVLAGMFLIGLVSQWLTNPVKLCPSKRNLFIYGCLFFAVTNVENDFFAYGTVVLRTFIIIQVLALIVYGPPHRAPSRAGLLPDRAVPRR